MVEEGLYDGTSFHRVVDGLRDPGRRSRGRRDRRTRVLGHRGAPAEHGVHEGRGRDGEERGRARRRPPAASSSSSSALMPASLPTTRSWARSPAPTRPWSAIEAQADPGPGRAARGARRDRPHHPRAVDELSAVEFTVSSGDAELAGERSGEDGGAAIVLHARADGDSRGGGPRLEAPIAGGLSRGRLRRARATGARAPRLRAHTVMSTWPTTPRPSWPREAGEGRPVLAGHSMGAHTIAATALRDPQRYAGLVLIGPAVDGGEPEPRVA